jgi:ABC-type branched-subunit amino acid transport system ATPase component
MTVIMIEHDMGVVMDISAPRHGARLRPKIASGCRRGDGAPAGARRAYLGVGDDVPWLEDQVAR